MKGQLSIKNEKQTKFTAKNIAMNYNNRGFASVEKIKTVLNSLKEQENLRSLKQLDQQKIENFVKNLKQKVESGSLTASTAQNYASALNTIIDYTNYVNNANLGHISAAEAGIHDTVQHTDKSISEVEISEIKENLANEGKENLALAVELQENFGLRFRESIGLNIETAKEALKTGVLSVGREDWTKNGREREISITTAEQKTILEKVIENIQNREVVNLAGGKNARDFSTIKEAYQEAYKEGLKFHSVRHTWAQQEYSKGWEQRGFQGIQAPVKFETKEAFRENLQEKTGLNISEAREIDREIRQEISEQLGHSRLDITHTYLGIF